MTHTLARIAEAPSARADRGFCRVPLHYHSVCSPRPSVVYVKRLFQPICVLALLAGLFLAACEDPSNVGEGLIGPQSGIPLTDQYPVNDLRPATVIQPDNLAPRVLAGQVDDPSLGTYTVQGYLDVTAVTSAGFRAQPLERVEIHLTPTYVYGDTTSQVTLAIRDVLEAWDQAGLSTDTSFSVGPVIREFTFQPTDSLVIVELPSDWVSEHDEIIRDVNFGELYHGFRLDPVSGNAVVGFGPNSTGLFAVTPEDSTASPAGTSYQHVARSSPAAPPPDRFLIQAGNGPGLAFSIHLSDIDLGERAVNRASIEFWADTVTVHQELPPHFVRPTLDALDLFGINQSGNATLIGRSSLDDDGRLVFDSPSVAGALERQLLGAVTFDHYELRIPDPNTLTGSEGQELYYYSSLNPIFLYDEGAGSRAPFVFMTGTPLD